MIAQLERQASQNQQPERHHQWQIEAAEAGGEQDREGAEHGATGGHQPDFVSISDRSNRANYLLPFRIGAGHEQVDDPGPQVESVEHDVPGEQKSDQTEPKNLHKSDYPLCFGAGP